MYCGCIVDVCGTEDKVLMTMDNRRVHVFDIHIYDIQSSESGYRRALHFPSLCLFCCLDIFFFLIFSQVPAKCLKSKLSVKRAISHHPPGDLVNPGQMGTWNLLLYWME